MGETLRSNPDSMKLALDKQTASQRYNQLYGIFGEKLLLRLRSTY